MNKKYLGNIFSLFLIFSTPTHAGLFAFLSSLTEEVSIRYEENQELITEGLTRCANSATEFAGKTKLNKKIGVLLAFLCATGCYAFSK